jgi:PadR family transcriptional regulator PadR
MHIEEGPIAAELTPLVLMILSESESDGYAIIKRLRELSGGDLEWADAMVYPLFHRLRRLGHLTTEWRSAPEGGRRKYYAITDDGRALLAKRYPGVEEGTALSDTHAEAASTPVVRPPAMRPHRLASVGRRLALAGTAAFVVLVVTLTPSGRSAIAEALDAFRGESVQVVAVDTTAWAIDVNAEDVRALETIGELDMSGMAEPTVVADLSEAESVAGITAPTLAEMPDRLVALAPGTVRLVLAAREGNGVPADLDGAALVVDIPGAIGAFYGHAGDGTAEVAIGRIGTLAVRAEGASLEAIRSFVLSRSELPTDLRAQLAAFDDWRSTIPVPVPVDGPGWEEVEVAGRPAVAFGDDSGIGTLVIRQDPDGVTVVVGRIGVSRALNLAGAA